MYLWMCSADLCAQSQGEILTFPANPKKGFQWEYALYLPPGMDTSQKLPLLLIMTDCGITDTAEEAKQKTLERLRYELSEYPVADALGVPLVMPIVQRPEDLYTHDLSRAVFTSQDEKFKRLDEQVLHMLQDARAYLKKYRHIRTQNKFLVTGFSAAGVFAWRWTMLHPEYVLAAATGGALYPMLPLEQWEGESLIYPVGVADFKPYTGKKFNQKAWVKIPIFVANGEMDTNDTFPYEECFAEAVERPVLQKVLPGENLFDRREQSLQLLAGLAPNVQTHLYPYTGHEPVTEDVVAFLQLHRHGGPLRPFTPTDTSDQKPSAVSVVQILRGDDPSLTDVERNYILPTDLVLKTAGTSPSWVYTLYGQISILQDGKERFSLAPRGSLSNGRYSLISYALSPADTLWPPHAKDCAWTLRAQHPDLFYISPSITCL